MTSKTTGQAISANESAESHCSRLVGARYSLSPLDLTGNTWLSPYGAGVGLDRGGDRRARRAARPAGR